MPEFQGEPDEISEEKCKVAAREVCSVKAQCTESQLMLGLQFSRFGKYVILFVLILLDIHVLLKIMPKSLMKGRYIRSLGAATAIIHPQWREHPIGLPKPQPSHEPPMPGPTQAPVTLEPDSSVGKKRKKGGKGREHRRPLKY